MSQIKVDPVCGMGISVDAAFAIIEHEGKAYFFCAPSCLDKFKQDPRRYVAGRGQESKGQ